MQRAPDFESSLILKAWVSSTSLEEPQLLKLGKEEAHVGAWLLKNPSYVYAIVLLHCVSYFNASYVPFPYAVVIITTHYMNNKIILPKSYRMHGKNFLPQALFFILQMII